MTTTHKASHTPTSAPPSPLIEEPAKQNAEQFRLRARVRLGIASINAYRQPRGANGRRNCAHCGTLETLAHMFAGCDRFRSHYRRRHDDSAEVTL